ncbi:hypothetical protein FNF31_03982 [Cafeteria roenbergensis]|uniref:FHA domain-containing protein n=1 Tax=Cafeteria roenbergensis TaxID=33653 RepID=A0A5A8DB48_CAFRO|nr:hypothetical protein FNF31_03982 [Cafeteria roenbergensis]
MEDDGIDCDPIGVLTIIRRKGQRGSSLEVCERLLLGRLESCDVRIRMSQVSRVHATIEPDYENGTVFVVPQPGRLVKVNDEVVDGARMLLSGDRIGIATRVLEFVYSDEDSAPTERDERAERAMAARVTGHDADAFDDDDEEDDTSGPRGDPTATLDPRSIQALLSIEARQTRAEAAAAAMAAAASPKVARSPAASKAATPSRRSSPFGAADVESSLARSPAAAVIEAGRRVPAHAIQRTPVRTPRRSNAGSASRHSAKKAAAAEAASAERARHLRSLVPALRQQIEEHAGIASSEPVTVGGVTLSADARDELAHAAGLRGAIMAAERVAAIAGEDAGASEDDEEEEDEAEEGDDDEEEDEEEDEDDVGDAAASRGVPLTPSQRDRLDNVADAAVRSALHSASKPRRLQTPLRHEIANAAAQRGLTLDDTASEIATAAAATKLRRVLSTPLRAAIEARLSAGQADEEEDEDEEDEDDEEEEDEEEEEEDDDEDEDDVGDAAASRGVPLTPSQRDRLDNVADAAVRSALHSASKPRRLQTPLRHEIANAAAQRGLTLDDTASEIATAAAATKLRRVLSTPLRAAIEARLSAGQADEEEDEDEDEEEDDEEDDDEEEDEEEDEDDVGDAAASRGVPLTPSQRDRLDNVADAAVRSALHSASKPRRLQTPLRHEIANAAAQRGLTLDDTASEIATAAAATKLRRVLSTPLRAAIEARLSAGQADEEEDEDEDEDEAEDEEEDDEEDDDEEEEDEDDVGDAAASRGVPLTPSQRDRLDNVADAAVRSALHSASKPRRLQTPLRHEIANAAAQRGLTLDDTASEIATAAAATKLRRVLSTPLRAAIEARLSAGQADEDEDEDEEEDVDEEEEEGKDMLAPRDGYIQHTFFDDDGNVVKVEFVPVRDVAGAHVSVYGEDGEEVDSYVQAEEEAEHEDDEDEEEGEEEPEAVAQQAPLRTVPLWALLGANRHGVVRDSFGMGSGEGRPNSRLVFDDSEPSPSLRRSRRRSSAGRRESQGSVYPPAGFFAVEDDDSEDDGVVVMSARRRSSGGSSRRSLRQSTGRRSSAGSRRSSGVASVAFPPDMFALEDGQDTDESDDIPDAELEGEELRREQAAMAAAREAALERDADRRARGIVLPSPMARDIHARRVATPKSASRRSSSSGSASDLLSPAERRMVRQEAEEAVDAALDLAASRNATPEQTQAMVERAAESAVRSAVRSALRGGTPGRTKTPNRRVSWGSELRRTREFDKNMEPSDVGGRSSWGEEGEDQIAEPVTLLQALDAAEAADDEHGESGSESESEDEGSSEEEAADQDADTEDEAEDAAVPAGLGRPLRVLQGDPDELEAAGIIHLGPGAAALQNQLEAEAGFAEADEEVEEEDDGLDTVHEHEDEDEDYDAASLARPSLLRPGEAILPAPRRRSSVGSIKARSQPTPPARRASSVMASSGKRALKRPRDSSGSAIRLSRGASPAPASSATPSARTSPAAAAAAASAEVELGAAAQAAVDRAMSVISLQSPAKRSRRGSIGSPGSSPAQAAAAAASPEAMALSAELSDLEARLQSVGSMRVVDAVDTLAWLGQDSKKCKKAILVAKVTAALEARIAEVEAALAAVLASRSAAGPGAAPSPAASAHAGSGAESDASGSEDSGEDDDADVADDEGASSDGEEPDPADVARLVDELQKQRVVDLRVMATARNVSWNGMRKPQLLQALASEMAKAQASKPKASSTPAKRSPSRAGAASSSPASASHPSAASVGKVLRESLRFADLNDLCLQVDAPRGSKATKNSMALSLARHHLTVEPIAKVAALLQELSPAEAAAASVVRASPGAAAAAPGTPSAVAASPSRAATADAVDDATASTDSAAVAAMADLLSNRSFNQLRKEASARGIKFSTRPNKAMLVETLSLVLAKESVEGDESDDDETDGEGEQDQDQAAQESTQAPSRATATAAGLEEDDADEDVDAAPAAAASAASPARATTAGGLLKLEPLSDIEASIARRGITDPADVELVTKDINHHRRRFRGRSHAWLANSLREHGVDVKPSFTRQQVIYLLADQCAFDAHDQRD